MLQLTDLFDEAIRQKASDIHLATGETPRLRVAGELVPFGDPLDLRALLEPFLTPEGWARLGAGMPFERTLVHGELAFVGIAFRVGDAGLAATFRLLPEAIPRLELIAEGAQEFFEAITETPRGLVLITGPTGSGKWTTVCSVVDAINSKKAARIFIVGAHPSYRFTSKKSLVTELHVGHDCESYSRALEIAQQADLDVVALDDLPTFETLREALTLASTGHLVIANLHAKTAVEAIERLIESAGTEGDALRRSLAENLVAVTAQRLLPGKEKGRAPAYEWIKNSPAFRTALLAGSDLSVAQAEDSESRTLTTALDALVASGRVAEETAAMHR